MSADVDVVYAEGEGVRIAGTRGVWRVTRIRLNGELDATRGDGKVRTFDSSRVQPLKRGDVVPERLGDRWKYRADKRR